VFGIESALLSSRYVGDLSGSLESVKAGQAMPHGDAILARPLLLALLALRLSRSP